MSTSDDEILDMWQDQWGLLSVKDREKFLGHPALKRIRRHERERIRELIPESKKLFVLANLLFKPTLEQQTELQDYMNDKVEPWKMIPYHQPRGRLYFHKKKRKP